MRDSRLTTALQDGALSLPLAGDLLVVGPAADADLSALPADRIVAVQGFRPDHDALAARGVRVVADLAAVTAPCAAAVVCLPRSRDQARAWISGAAARVAPGGPVAVDGAKTDGIEAVLKELRGHVDLGPALSRAHGKLAVFAATALPADWADAPRPLPGGWITRPGVFSADGPDAGSALLAGVLPDSLPGRGADLGAGWGFLARAALARADVRSLDLVEADHVAVDCARLNLPDSRAAFHWADATTFRPVRPVDWVVMNPPFHQGRAADPALGQAFLRNAARILTRDGVLWLVVNRHLPYADTLATLFRAVDEIGGTPVHRLYRCSGPRPPAKGRA